MNAQRLMSQQSALLARLWGRPAEGDLTVADHPRGWQAYQNNARALADRALAAAYPVLRQCVGEDTFAAIAADFWHQHPPVLGDLAQWGEALADWLKSSQAAHELPHWLPDLAVAEWTLHAMATLPDALLDAPSLAQLLEQDPDGLALIWAPGFKLWRAPSAVVSVLHAHGAATAGGELDLALAGQRLRDGVQETALFWRQGWRPCVTAVADDEAAWLQALIHEPSLGSAMTDMGTRYPLFDLGAWLQQSVQSGLVLGVRPHHRPS
jgi:hypothetical protein